MSKQKGFDIFDIVFAFMTTLILGHIFGIISLIGLVVVCFIASIFIVLVKTYINDRGIEL